MQTVIVIAARVAGAVYLNGRFVGETDADRPLSLPVAPFGPLFLELRPFTPGFLPLSVRLPLSAGRPLLPRPDDRLCAAVWPGGVVELELSPERTDVSSLSLGEFGGVRLAFLPDPSPRIRCETASGVLFHALPDAALRPACTPLPGGLLLSGDLPDARQYALVLSPDASSVRLLLTGRGLSLPDGGNTLRMLCSADDTVGHAFLDTWACSSAEWRRVSSEPMWETGGPVWPDTPEKTALAALEAAQLGLPEEAASFFAPGVPCTEILARAALFDGCTPLRHALPDGRPAVGLTRLNQSVLLVSPARYTVSPGGAHGLWQLTGLFIDESA